MGMFDDVRFEKSPVACKCGRKLEGFQTKDFDCLMDMYVISKKNVLKREVWRLVSLTKKEIAKEKKERPNWLYVPSVKRKHISWKKVNCGTMTLHCYTFCKCGMWYDVFVFWHKGKFDGMKVKKRRMSWIKNI